MTTKRRRIEILGTPVEIVRKDIRNLHLGVYPPNGRVRVAAPLRLDDQAVRLAVITRLGWIRRQQRRFEQQVRQSRRDVVTGESHYYQGRRYRLNVKEHNGPPSIRLANNTVLTMLVRRGTEREGRDALLQRWYRARLRDQIPVLVEKWEEKVGVTVSEVRIRKMKTRWGSCNAEVGRIWLNLELAKKSVGCLEYILVHEMVHLLERHHSERFRELMDGVMPGWRRLRDELNRAPLGHEEWRY